jgi:hypothetical protein
VDGILLAQFQRAHGFLSREEWDLASTMAR